MFIIIITSLIKTIFIILCLSLLLMMAIEIINYCRYTNILKKLKDIQKNNHFDNTCLESYSNFMITNISNDNFLRIFKACYPDQIMNTSRIKTTLSYYIYNISDIAQIPPTMTIMHKTINYLTAKLSKQYVLSSANISTKIKEWINIDDDILYKNIYETTKNYINNTIAKERLIKNEYICLDLSPHIRYYHKDNKESKFINIIITGIEGINLTPTSSSLNNYIEICNIAPYHPPFHEVNEFITIDNIAKEFRFLFASEHIDKKVNLCCSDIMTIFIPYLAKYYADKINSIQMIDPISYPYAYQTIYQSIASSDDEKIKKIRKNIYLMMMLKHNPLIDVYLNALDYSDHKNIHILNKIYSYKTHVAFTQHRDLFTNSDILTTQMTLRSYVHL